MLLKYEKGNYSGAHVYAARIRKFINQENLKILLFGAYLCVLQGDGSLARKWLEDFYGALLSSSLLVENRGLNESEKNWILVFAEYLLLTLTSRGVEQISPDSGPLTGDARNVDFTRVRGIIRRMFPPAHLGEIESYFRKHGKVAD